MHWRCRNQRSRATWHTCVNRELLLAERHGHWMYYRINPDLPAWAASILDNTLTGTAQTEPFCSDHRILKDMPDRPEAGLLRVTRYRPEVHHESTARTYFRG